MTAPAHWDLSTLQPGSISIQGQNWSIVPRSLNQADISLVRVPGTAQSVTAGALTAK